MGDQVFQGGPVSRLGAIAEALPLFKVLKARTLANLRLALAVPLLPSTAKARTIKQGNRAAYSGRTSER